MVRRKVMLLYAKNIMYLQSVKIQSFIHFIVTFYIRSLTQLRTENFLALIKLRFEGKNCNCLMNTLSKLQNSQLLQSFLEIFNSSHFAGKRIWRIHPCNFQTGEAIWWDFIQSVPRCLTILWPAIWTLLLT